MNFWVGIFIAVQLFGGCLSNPPNFNYDFSGFHQLTKLLTTSCSGIEGQVGWHTQFYLKF
jgi:hypothetical protein